MKKNVILTSVLASLSTLAIVAGSAQAATYFTAEHVYTFNSANDVNFSVDEIVPFGDKIAIELRNGELWISDGTEAGTYSLQTALTSAGLTGWGIERANDAVESLDIDGELYFFGNNGEIYKTDGTTVTRVTTGLYQRNSMYYFDGKIYVSADGFFQIDPLTGAIVEIYDAIDCRYPSATQVQMVGGKIVFVADEDNCDEQLYTWDPASPSAAAVALTAVSNGLGSFNSDNDYMDNTNNSFTMFNGEMYFAASGNNGTGSIGTELFKTDGTQAGTVLVKDLALDPGDSSDAPASNFMNPTVFNGELYFTDTSGVIYKTDGTTSGTTVVIEDDTFSRAGEFTRSPALVHNGKMITDFHNDATGNALYTTDGTVAGTKLLIDTNVVDANRSIGDAEPNRLTKFNGHVFFFGYDNVSTNVWVTDGTTPGGYQVSTFGSRYATGNDSEYGLVPAGDNLFFAVNDNLENGGTGEMALYKIGAEEGLAPTGAELNATTLSSLVAMALIALAGAALITRGRSNKA